MKGKEGKEEGRRKKRKLGRRHKRKGKERKKGGRRKERKERERAS